MIYSNNEELSDDELREIEEEEFDERADACYECGGYGDDYYYDEERDELVCNCDNCYNNPANWED